jgi:hypothetical protein
VPTGTRAFVLAQIERDTRNRPTALQHRVALAKVGGVWTILGRPIGHPA